LVVVTERGSAPADPISAPYHVPTVEPTRRSPLAGEG
jgi:hypothetical protein